MNKGIKNAISSNRPRALEEEMIRQKIDSLFIQAEEAKDERRGLHASAIIAPEGEFCLREQLLSLFYKQNQGKELPVATRKIFHHGNVVHEEVYDVLRKSGVLINNEVTRYVEKYDLYFTIDANVHLFNKDWIVDVKSMNDNAFNAATGHPHGERQVLFYEWLYRKKDGFVLAYNKNTSAIKIFIVTYDKEKVRPFVERLEAIKDARELFIESHEIPNRMCESMDCKRASTCNMRDACWKVGMGRVRLDGKTRSDENKEDT